MNMRDATGGTDKIICQICGRSLSPDEVVPADRIHEPVAEIIKKKYPDWSDWGHICLADLNRLRAVFILNTLEDMRGDLVEMGQKIKNRFEKFERRSKGVRTDTQTGRTFGQRVADGVANFGGSWIFIISFITFMAFWVVLNTILLYRRPFDPFPFILLNLVLSCIAAMQAPIIMMSQNRQDAKDRLRGELDFDVNRRAESEIQGLARKLNLLSDKIDDVEELLRQKPL
jgi:uncharacterized membrane protein